MECGKRMRYELNLVRLVRLLSVVRKQKVSNRQLIKDTFPNKRTWDFLRRRDVATFARFHQIWGRREAKRNGEKMRGQRQLANCFQLHLINYSELVMDDDETRGNAFLVRNKTIGQVATTTRDRPRESESELLFGWSLNLNNIYILRLQRKLRNKSCLCQKSPYFL